MVLMLALHGCLNGTTQDGTHGPPPDGHAAALFGDTVDIATTPYRGEFPRAPVRRGSPPRAEVIVRDCYGEADESRNRQARGPNKPSPSPKPAPAPRGGYWPAPSPAAEAPMATAPTPDAAPPPPPAPLPAAPPTGNEGGAIGRGTNGLPGATEVGGAVQQGARGGAADGFASNDPSPAEPTRSSGEGHGAKAGKSKGPPRREQKPVDDITTIGDSEYDSKDRESAKKEVARAWDYGARLFLSNDDSMSLASAQRILWALQRNVPLRTSEIRPHELLNYFSFDSVAPAADRTFGVLGSATQDGDTLTVALAVRGANPERQPLDLTLLVDRSCSMSAEGRMDYTKRGLGQLAANLQDGDRIDLVLFDSNVCTPVENFVIGRDDPSILNGAIAKMQPHTGTNLNLGLQAAYGIQTGRDAAEVHDRNRRVLLVTDALLNEGQVEQSLVAQVGTNLETHDIRLSGVGVGREFNDKMLDKLTENGKGAYVYLGSEAVVDRVFGPMFDALVRTVAHDVHFSIDLPESLAMEKFYGEEASTNREDVKPIHYYAGTTQLFLQDLHVRETGAVREDPITMRIEYRDAITDEPMVQELKTTVGALLDADPHNVQKGQALMAFSDWVLAGPMGTDPCARPLQVYRERSSVLEGDAEIGFVNGLVGQRCGVPMTTVVSRGVQLKLKLDTDQPIANVSLVCAGREVRETLRPGDSVARFASVEPGDCTVQLDGQMPMSAAVTVPATGGDLRCVVRGGRVSCS